MRGTVAKRLRMIAAKIKSGSIETVLEDVKGHQVPVLVTQEDGSQKFEGRSFPQRKISHDCLRGAYQFMKRQYKEAKRG